MNNLENNIKISYNEISYNKDTITLKNIKYNIKDIIFVVSKPITNSNLFKVRITYMEEFGKSNSIWYNMDINTLDKFNIIIELGREIILKDPESENKSNSKKNSLFIILYLLIIMGGLTWLMAYEETNESNKKFEFNYVYDVNKNKCEDILKYKHEFSDYELSNPKFVGEFPQRPGELVYINLDDEMYVFTDTIERCLAYQKYFIDEMNRQINDENNRYNDNNFIE